MINSNLSYMKSHLDRQILTSEASWPHITRKKHKFFFQKNTNFFQKNTNFYLQQLRKKNKLSNIYVLFSALEEAEESVGCFAHPSRRTRGTTRASVHSSSQCLHTRGKRALGTTQCTSRQHALNITITLAITKMIRNLLCSCYGSLQRARCRSPSNCPAAPPCARKKDGTET